MPKRRWRNPLLRVPEPLTNYSPTPTWSAITPWRTAVVVYNLTDAKPEPQILVELRGLGLVQQMNLDHKTATALGLALLALTR